LTLRPTISYPNRKPPVTMGAFLWLVALLAPWAFLIRRLCFLWETDPQYAYGWSVPALAAVLACLRWPGQPARQQVRAGVLIFLVAALILPIRVLQEAAPDWSVANWSLGLAATLLTFLLLCRSGGLRWACWFLFPLLFLLTAIPWPQRLDLWLTQSLMQRVAALTVELLGWLSIPAFRQGNLIHLPVGPIGIDEACSGIRSLQAMLMASLFLGELCRLTVFRRIGLVLAGFVLAFAGNVIRTTLLSAIAARSGLGSIHAWHDPAGLAILCFGLAGAWLLATFWRSPVSPMSATGSVSSIPQLPALFPVGIILSLLFTEASVHLWYAAHESTAPSLHLAFAWPSQEKTFHSISIPESARRVLLFSSGDAAAWQDSAGRGWSAYHLTWAPGRTSTQSARMHRPETCLEATGAVLIRDFGREVAPVPGGSLSCREYLFQRDGAPLYVLFSLFEQRPADRDPGAMLQDWSGWSRIQRALAGQRNLGQESVELAMAPSPSEPYPDTSAPIGLLKTRLTRLVSLVPLVSLPPAQR